MSKIKEISKPAHLSLTVHSELRASHSLQGFETPHFHLWKISVSFQTELPIEQDRLIDLVFLNQTLETILTPYSGKFLNDALAFSPTSENLALWLWSQVTHALPDAPLSGIEITLCDLEGRASGSARIWK